MLGERTTGIRGVVIYPVIGEYSLTFKAPRVLRTAHAHDDRSSQSRKHAPRSSDALSRNRNYQLIIL